MHDRFDVVVVGAGITGLTSAFFLARAGRRVAVVEAAPTVGGVMRSRRVDGYLFELGPNTVLEKEPIAELLRDAALEPLPAQPAGKRRYIWKGDRLVALPGGPVDFLTTGLLPLSAKLRVLVEPLLPRADLDDESVASFVRRRLGPPWLRWMVGPFVSGVWAGDPELLSVRWALPVIHGVEREHGSLVRGMIARRKGGTPAGRMISFPSGIQELPLHLAGRAGEVATGSPVTGLRQLPGGGWEVRSASRSWSADEVVLATDSEATVRLVEPLAPEIALLGDIAYAPVVVAGLGFAREEVPHPLDGFGYLAPRGGSVRILGCLFSSSLFPGRAPEGHVALTTFAGGRTDPGLVAAPEEEVLAVVRADLERSLGITAPPRVAVVERWPRAIPQYEVGHGRFVQRVREVEQRLAGLHLAGSSSGGVSVSDCVKRGREVACRVLSRRAAEVGVV